MRMRLGSRRSMCAHLAGCALLLLLAAGARAQAPDGPPNVVVVMADDLDVGSLDTMVEAGLVPHFAQLFRNAGVRFNHAFVSHSICAPSRATFLTGQYSHNHGVLTNFSPSGGVKAFEDSSTLATWLQASGYRTGHVGKYLNLYGIADLDGDGDTDEADRTYVPPGWDDWQALVDPSTYRVYNYFVNDNGRLAFHGSEEGDYQTDVLARRAAEFIAESDAIDDEAPFFLAVMPIAPHVEVFLNSTAREYTDPWRWTIRPAPRHADTIDFRPRITPSFNEEDVSDKPAWLQAWPRLTWTDYLYLVRQYRDRLESVRALDDLLGLLADELESRGELERTVLVFTSDNGLLHGQHRLPEKQYAYEESIQVPLEMRIPGMPGGRTIDGLVLNNDLAPTIVDLAGAAAGLPMDGRSFLPLLHEPAPSTWRRRFLVEHWTTSDRLIVAPTYGAVRTGPEDPSASNLLYVEYEDGSQTPELYDLVLDPDELQSLHEAAEPGRLQQKALLAEWLGRLQVCGQGSCQSLEFDAAP